MTEKKRPGRPKKPIEQVRSTDLRIPVTPSEKDLVQTAAKIAEGSGEMASWARNILIHAAERVIARRD
jgi:uncharacterized protein (DUF1778 family)